MNLHTSLARRTLSVIAALAIGFVASNGLAQNRSLHLGSTPWTPFTNPPGEARFAIDLVHAALARIGITANTTIVPEGTLTPGLVNAQFDGSAALWRDDQREMTLIYSQPYLQNRIMLVGRRGSDVSATTPAALAGKRVALVDGFSYGEAVTVARDLIRVPSRSVEESLQKVLADDADYALMDELVVQYFVRNYPAEVAARLALGTVPLVVRPLHFALRRSVPDAQSIVDRFNTELRMMIADRSYHRLLRLEWIEADVDGDGRVESVPASDQVGQSPPGRGYELIALTTPAPQPVPAAPNQRFYLGGRVYEGWSSVPDTYKVPGATQTSAGTAVVPLFTFRW